MAKAFELGQDHHLLVCNIETVCSVEVDLLLHPLFVGWLDVQLVAIPVLLTFTDRFCVWRGRGLAALDCRVFPQYRDQKLTQSAQIKDHTVCGGEADEVAELSLAGAVPEQVGFAMVRDAAIAQQLKRFTRAASFAALNLTLQ